MINVRYYEQRAAYDADKPKLMLPNVSYCEDTDEVFYNPKPHDYSNDYLTFVAEENGTFKFNGNSVNYSVDDGETWIELASNTDTPTVPVGGTIMFKATLTPASWVGIGIFSSTGSFTAQGNPMSLLHGDNFIGQTSLSGKDWAFNRLFSGCTGLTSTENISLPATTLAGNCYSTMFAGCESLTTAPSLPATTLAGNCYSNMFSGCTSLTTAPSLPATTLASYCYQGMFNGCTSLTTTPSLTATTLAGNCYYNMFKDCTSLITSPGLPATTLAESCYNGMFQGCTSLTTAPALPATTLAYQCYMSMFTGCTSLTTAPELPATTLAKNCYWYMFDGCLNLNSITCLATDISASNCTNGWVRGVAASGTFIKADSMTSWTTGNSGIPTGWDVEDYQP